MLACPNVHARCRHHGTAGAMVAQSNYHMSKIDGSVKDRLAVQGPSVRECETGCRRLQLTTSGHARAYEQCNNSAVASTSENPTPPLTM